MDKKITRKEAIKKVGVTALAATSLVFLNTKAKACTSGCTTECTPNSYSYGFNGQPNPTGFGFGNFPKPTNSGFYPRPQVPFAPPQIPWAPPTGTFNPPQFDWRSLFSSFGW